MSDYRPVMVARPLGFFSEWFVEITWPEGRVQKVHGFKDEAHANGWIRQEQDALAAKFKPSDS